jgi:hypothetical protein
MDTLHRFGGIFENQFYLYLEGKPDWMFFWKGRNNILLLNASLFNIDRNLTHILPCYWINCFRNLGAIPPLSNRARQGVISSSGRYHPCSRQLSHHVQNSCIGADTLLSTWYKCIYDYWSDVSADYCHACCILLSISSMLREGGR